MSGDQSKLTAAQWVEAIGILIASGLVIVVPLLVLGSLLHVRFLVFGAPALALPIGLWLERQITKWKDSGKDRH